MRRGKTKLFLVLVLLLAIVTLVPIVLVMNRPSVKAIPLPTPNAYDTLADAGNMVVKEAELFDLEDVEKLKEFVQVNSAAFVLIDDATKQQAVVPINYESGEIASEIDSVSAIRQALRLQLAKSKIADVEMDPINSATEYARLLTLANKTDEGGLLLHFQVASAYRRAALQGLYEVAGELDEKMKDEVASIMAINGTRPLDMDAVMQREEALAKSQHGVFMGTIMRWHTGSQAAIEQAKAIDAEIQLLEKSVFMSLID